LNHTDRARELIAGADVILGLELTDFWGTVDAYRDQLRRTSRPLTRPGAKLVSVTAGDLYMKGNYQDIQRYPEVDLALAADAETTLPSLIESVKRFTTGDRSRVFEERGRKLAGDRQKALDRARTEATYGWNASPISTARLSAELWAQIKDSDWSLVSPIDFVSRWPMRLWEFNKPYQFLGASGGAGVGYGAPASVGAALAN
jgi:acetolactate synthase-1/2/3 large subunit